ncbi:MAG: hypothetical protein O3A46_17725, partial [Candidatus Poribacteria bacterium]|nr:hypothetical protein [Candidatus Poribacteria bacterium]
YAVAEEPVDAARLLAPFTVATHIKDMTIRPLTDGEWVKVNGCPLGQGDVDLAQIADILLDAAPDAPFTIEVEPARHFDKWESFLQSVEYVKTALGDRVQFRNVS